jgi:hypothetical protein
MQFHHFHTPNSTPTITIDLLAVSLPATCLITAPCLTEMYHFWWHSLLPLELKSV